LEIAMKKEAPKSKKKIAEREITDDTIAARAYERWQQRGCPLWDQDQDWFTARAELEQESAKTTRSDSEDA
jgi:hypothetical protein